MRYKSISQPKRLHWIHKILIVLAILFVIFFGFSIYLYNYTLSSKNMNFEETKKVIINQTPMKKVKSIERFHGDEAYHVVYGINENDEDMVIFYPMEGKEKNIIPIKTSEILSKEEVYRQWISSCENCKLVDIKLGLLDDTILWEFTYYNENNQYVLEYLSSENGEIMEQFRFNKMFN